MWLKKSSTRPNFHIICSKLHGCGTVGQELSPGGAHRDSVETSLSVPSQSTAFMWGISHIKDFKPVQYSEFEAFSISARMQTGVQNLMPLRRTRGAYSLLDPKGEEMGYRVCDQRAVYCLHRSGTAKHCELLQGGCKVTILCMALKSAVIWGEVFWGGH